MAAATGFDPACVFPEWDSRIQTLEGAGLSTPDFARQNVWVPQWWIYPAPLQTIDNGLPVQEIARVQAANLERMERYASDLSESWALAKRAGAAGKWRKLRSDEMSLVAGPGSLDFHLSPFVEECDASVIMPPAKYNPFRTLNLLEETGRMRFDGRYGVLHLNEGDKFEVWTAELIAMPLDAYGQGTTNSTNARHGFVATNNSFGLNPGWAGQVKLEAEYKGFGNGSTAVVPLGCQLGQAALVRPLLSGRYRGPYGFQTWYSDVTRTPPVDLRAFG